MNGCIYIYIYIYICIYIYIGCCTVLRSVAVCCSVLQCVAVWCSLLHSKVSCVLIRSWNSYRPQQIQQILCVSVCGRKRKRERERDEKKEIVWEREKTEKRRACVCKSEWERESVCVLNHTRDVYLPQQTLPHSTPRSSCVFVCVCVRTLTCICACLYVFVYFCVCVCDTQKHLNIHTSSYFRGDVHLCIYSFVSTVAGLFFEVENPMLVRTANLRTDSRKTSSIFKQNWSKTSNLLKLIELVSFSKKSNERNVGWLKIAVGDLWMHSTGTRISKVYSRCTKIPFAEICLLPSEKSCNFRPPKNSPAASVMVSWCMYNFSWHLSLRCVRYAIVWLCVLFFCVFYFFHSLSNFAGYQEGGFCSGIC